MLRKAHSRGLTKARNAASLFAALGDETRLSLLAKLSGGQRFSITQLTAGSHLSRQAVTKHLRVLQRVKIARCVRAGRESLFEFDPQPVMELKQYLDLVFQQWDEALGRLKLMVETEESE
jgi:DNA-binding transcriptional ArsR family regulator